LALDACCPLLELVLKEFRSPVAFAVGMARERAGSWERRSAFVKQPVSAECVPQPPPRQLLQGGKESFQSLHSRPNAPAAGCSVDAHLINRPSAEKARKVTTALWNSIKLLVSLLQSREIFSQTLPNYFHGHRGFADQ
jgi:hypothetical protein